MHDARAIESWTWFGVASLILVLRYISRAIRLGGWRFFELEDYVMVVAFGFYTNLIVWVNIQQKHPRTNILPPTGLKGLSDADINDRIYGSKITFTIEESMVMTQFLTKVCMCLLFYKLTSGLKRQLQVKFVLGFVVLGWLITEIFFFGIWCRPFMNYFRVFEGIDPHCATSQSHLIMSFAFNLSSDIALLTIPVPMLLASQLPLKQKASITGVFSLGIFVIIAATLSRYYCFAHPESILWIFWYVREASTCVIVSNVPHLYALLRKILDVEKLGSYIKRSKRSRYASCSNDVELRAPKAGDRNKGKRNDGRTESTEGFATIGSKPTQPLHIWQQSEYSVNDNAATEVQLEEQNLHSVWQGELGTTATVVSTKSSHSPER